MSTFTRVTDLSGKVRRRMYKRALGDLKGLQMRSKEKLDSLNFTVDLVCTSVNFIIYLFIITASVNIFSSG